MKPWITSFGDLWPENGRDGPSPWFLSCCAAIWQKTTRRIFHCRGITLINSDKVPDPPYEVIKKHVIQTRNGPLTILLHVGKDMGQLSWTKNGPAKSYARTPDSDE